MILKSQFLAQIFVSIWGCLTFCNKVMKRILGVSGQNFIDATRINLDYSEYLTKSQNNRSKHPIYTFTVISWKYEKKTFLMTSTCDKNRMSTYSIFKLTYLVLSKSFYYWNLASNTFYLILSCLFWSLLIFFEGNSLYLSFPVEIWK